MDSNNYISTLNGKLRDKYVVGIIFVVFIISFFLWMEYKAYQIRSAFIGAVSWINDSFRTQKSQSPVNKEEKSKIEVKKWESYTYENWLKLSVDSFSPLWKEFIQDGFFKKTANNTFYQIIMIWENSGKIPQHKSFYRSILVTKDWTSYESIESIQMPWKRDWFWWCIECNLNPNDKAIQWILFDINVPYIEWAKVIIDWISFNL